MLALASENVRHRIKAFFGTCVKYTSSVVDAEVERTTKAGHVVVERRQHWATKVLIQISTRKAGSHSFI
jgi:hypothetical protein